MAYLIDKYSNIVAKFQTETAAYAWLSRHPKVNYSVITA